MIAVRKGLPSLTLAQLARLVTTTPKTTMASAANTTHDSQLAAFASTMPNARPTRVPMSTRALSFILTSKEQNLVSQVILWGDSTAERE